MFGDFFRRLIQILTLGAVAATIYLDFLFVPSGYVTFLHGQGDGGFDNRGIFAYERGISFVPTLFVPFRWRKYQVEVQPRTQEIRIRLPLKYSAYLRLGDLFYVQLRLKVETEIPGAGAYAALKGLQFKPTERDHFLDEQLQFLANAWFLDANTDEGNLERTKAELTAFFSNGNLPEIQRRLDAQLRGNWLKLVNLDLREIYVPDSRIYAAQVRNIDQVAAADRRALLAQIEKEAELAVERKRNLEDLAKADKMGALIAENPDILEYYKVEKIAPRAGSVILDASAPAGGKKRDITIRQDKKPTRGKDGKGEDDSEAGGEIRP